MEWQEIKYLTVEVPGVVKWYLESLQRENRIRNLTFTKKLNSTQVRYEQCTRSAFAYFFRECGWL